jgi:serine/threonine protein kinase
MLQESGVNLIDQSRGKKEEMVFVFVAGTLRDGSVVAVKRLYKNSYKSVEQFQNEVEILSRLRHRNLVTLYGCTSPRSSQDLLLVYEFVPNGTLADHLHGARASGSAPPLPWPVRLGIAVETASALHYLHAVEPRQVVHRDVKTNNILLDEAFHVKVADFGLSRLFPAHATHVSTAPQGTPGYVDPMYHLCYQLTDKSDVYSFGVVLVELISSKPAVDMSRAGPDVNLANLAVHMIQCYEIDRLVDPRLGYGTSAETKRTVDIVAEVAFRCLQPEQDVRPPISEVLDTLREARKTAQAGCAKVKDDVELMKKSRDGSPDSVMYKWTSPSTTAHNSS